MAVLVAAAALGVGVLAGQRSVPPPQAETSPAASPTVVTTLAPSGVPEGFAEFASEEAGFSIAYPRAWRRLQPRDPQVKLVADDETGGSILVRVVPLGFNVTPDQLEAVRPLTDDLVTAHPGVKLVTDPKQITLAGLPGWFYLYTFQDEGSKLRGAHSHFFLFHRETLFALVFQGLPVDRFPELAPTFDRIAGTFRVTSP